MDFKQHIENSLANIRVMFEETAGRIEALKPGEKIPATKLAQDIAELHDLTGPQLYPVLLFLFKDYPNVEIRRGAHGGIFKLGGDVKPSGKKTVVVAVDANASCATPAVSAPDATNDPPKDSE